MSAAERTVRPLRGSGGSIERLGQILGSRAAFLLLIGIYAVLVRFSYVGMIALSPLFRFSGAVAFPAPPFSVPLAYAFALLPGLWVRRQPRVASDEAVLYLFAFVHVPTCILLPSVTLLPLGQQVLFMAVSCLALGSLELRRLLGYWEIPELAVRRVEHFEWFLIIALGLVAGYLLWFGQIDLSTLLFSDIYERRAELLQDQGSATTSLMFYIANWSSMALIPMSLIVGLRRRNLLLCVGGLTVAVLSFAATSFKSNFFVPAIAAFVYLLSSGANLKWRGYLTLTTIVLPSVLLGIFDLLFNYDPLLTWNFEFRMVGNNGFLSGKYYAFFLDMPKGLYADSVGGMFASPVYNRPIAEVVGEDFSQLAGNHANANLWADGYGNLGLWGVALSSLEALLLFWLIDSFSRNKDLRLSTALMIPVGFALSNTAVHSMLTSNGGLLLLLLLVVMPRSLFDRTGPT